MTLLATARQNGRAELENHSLDFTSVRNEAITAAPLVQLLKDVIQDNDNLTVSKIKIEIPLRQSVIHS